MDELFLNSSSVFSRNFHGHFYSNLCGYSFANSYEVFSATSSKNLCPFYCSIDNYFAIRNAFFRSSENSFDFFCNYFKTSSAILSQFASTSPLVIVKANPSKFSKISSWYFLILLQLLSESVRFCFY